MATFTPFLKLRKTANADLADVKRDINNNLDLIDEKIGAMFDEPWLKFNNPLTNVTYRVHRCKYKVLGKNILLYQGALQFTAAPTSWIIINMPPGITLASAYIGQVSIPDGAVIGHVKALNSVGRILRINPWSAQVAGPGHGVWTTAVPFAWASGNSFDFTIRAEIE